MFGVVLSCSMASQHLTTIRAHRKQHSLSQGDLAYLLGSVCGSKICRYEMAQRVPSLETSIALAVVFKVPLQELFPDLHEQVTEDIIRRAHRLLKEMDVSGTFDVPKRSILESIVGRA